MYRAAHYGSVDHGRDEASDLEVSMTVFPPNWSWRRSLDILASLAMISCSVIVAAMALTSRDARSSAATLAVPTSPIPIADAPTKGTASAQLVLIEFADFQCPYCRSFAQGTLGDLARDLVGPGKLRIVFRNLPLNIHPLAAAAAEAALCADEQRLFWEMHDSLFSGGPRLSELNIQNAAKEAGLNITDFNACITSQRMRRRVNADIDLAGRLGVKGTPAFLVATVLPDGTAKGIEWLGGALPYSRFKEALEKAERRKGSLTERWSLTALIGGKGR
jgi:protein-disulfide isomerase